MNKYLGLFLAIVFFSIPPVFSQETVTITTYYPSPAGVYNELLVANRMSVGDTNGDGRINQLDLPTDAAGNPLPNSFQTVNSLTDRQVVGDVNGDGAINGGDLGQDAAGNARNGTLTVANALGIGTINPQGELHVRSTDNTNGHANLILEGENPATGATAGSWDITALGSTGSNGVGANAGALQFNSTNTAGNTTTPVTVSSGAPNNSIFIAPNGNVGIGTDNPRGRLDVTARDGNGNLGGFYPPSMTTADRNSIPAAMLREGMMIYNTNTHQLEMYRPGIGWITVGGSAEVIIVSPDDRSQWSSGLACQPNSDSEGRKYYAFARCPDGYKVIGGGHRFIKDSDARCGCDDEQWRFVVESFPLADRSGWQLNTACFIGKPYAVCQKE